MAVDAREAPPKRRKRPVHQESIEQRWLFHWAVTMRIPGLSVTDEDGDVRQARVDDFLFHIPNGGMRSKVEAAIMKAEGVKPGIPDLLLSIMAQGYGGLYIELKALKGRAPTEKQLMWHARLRDQGYKVCVCYGWRAAAVQICHYLNLKQSGLE